MSAFGSAHEIWKNVCEFDCIIRLCGTICECLIPASLVTSHFAYIGPRVFLLSRVYRNIPWIILLMSFQIHIYNFPILKKIYWTKLDRFDITQQEKQSHKIG